MSAIQVRPERAADAAAVRLVHERAFGRAEEALLVGTIHAAGATILSLVTVQGATLVGHILFSPVRIERARASQDAVGLGPMAVLPEFQRQGIGSLLVREGLEALRRAGHAAVVVLGHPAYYPRFGFVPASRFGLRWEFPAPEEAFLACELRPGSLQGGAGIVRYRAEFRGL
jgi:putative acetyltransferase